MVECHTPNWSPGFELHWSAVLSLSKSHLLQKVPEADPGFLEGGFNSTKGGSYSTYLLIFHNEYEIVWGKRGG